MKTIIALIISLATLNLYAAKDVSIRLHIQSDKTTNLSDPSFNIVKLVAVDGTPTGDKVQLLPMNEETDAYLSELKAKVTDLVVAEYTCTAKLGETRLQGTLKTNVMVKIAPLFSLTNCTR